MKNFEVISMSFAQAKLKAKIALAILAVIVFSMAACVFNLGDDSSGGGSGSWTTANSSFGDSTVVDIAHGGGKFVAGDRNGDVATSTDGIRWTKVADEILSSYDNNENDIVAIAYGSGRFVAVGEKGRIAYSSGL
jgi:hypothetical protein